MKVSLFVLLCTDVTINKSQSNYQCNNKVTADLRLLQIDKKNFLTQVIQIYSTYRLRTETTTKRFKKITTWVPGN